MAGNEKTNLPVSMNASISTALRPQGASTGGGALSSKKLNIALLCDSYLPMIDGVIMITDQYAKMLSQKANVFVAVPRVKKGYDDNQHPYKIIRCKSFKLFFIDYHCPRPNADRRFKKFLKEADIDIIHIHSPFFIGKMGIKIAHEKNIPVVATMHSQFKQDFKRAVKSSWLANILTHSIIKTFNACDEVWAVNEGTQEILKDYGYKKPAYVMRSGTDMLPQDKAASKKKIYETHGIDHQTPMLLFVGRINLMKNILFIADALKILKDRGFDYKMIYIGSGQDTDSLAAHIKKLDLQDNVILAGKIMDRVLLSKYYAAAALTLFPSIYDTDGIVKYEGASQHTPTVLIEGITAAIDIEDGVNGYVSKPTAEDFAQKIKEILTDPKTYAQVCENVFNNLYKTWPERLNEIYDRYLYLIEQHKIKTSPAAAKTVNELN
ncbi:MAG: glycosyltransferase [Burkholderiaceae bacterium]|nr:glycosyltransferase [Burkholderiaceae bacterium]